MRLSRLLMACVALAVLLGGGSACASEAAALHRIGPAQTFENISTAVLAFKDRTGSLRVDQAAAEFDRLGDAALARNPRLEVLAPNELALWQKFDLALDGGAPRDVDLLVELPALDSVILYKADGAGGWTAFPEMGAALPFSHRLERNPAYVFPLRLEPGVPVRLMLRLNDPGVAAVKVSVWDPATLAARDNRRFAIYCLYFGLVAGMLLYNLLLYVVTRDVGFLFYVGQIGSIAIASAGSSGYGAMYVWGDYPTVTFASAAGFGFLFIFVGLLTRQFVSSRERLPKLDKWLLAVSVIGFIGGFPALLGNQWLPVIILVPAAFAIAIFITVLSAVAAYRRWPGSAYFCAAWVSLYAAICVGLVLRVKSDLFSFVNPTELLMLGSAFEMILLSLALADRINEERRQKERAQSQTLAIVQASEALGRETRLDSLYTLLCETMAHVAGAARVSFVLLDEDLNSWFLYGSWDAAKRIPVEAAGEAGLLPLSVFQRVRFTGERLVLDDACTDPRFAADPAWRGMASCSVLAMPVVRHGATRAIMILQHGGRTASFPEAAVEAVAAIAGPLAVSLENVLLYERLEQRVAEQTRELRDTQRELLATARLAGRAEVAANVLHNIGNTLTSVNVAAELIGAELAASRGPRLREAADMIDAHADCLAPFLQDDPKGRLIPAYIREASRAIADEHSRMEANLCRLRTSIGHIRNVLAAQQGMARGGAFTELVRPADVANGAMELVADDLRGARVKVVTAYEDVPAARLDTTRITEILVNLVSNAMHAMEKNEEAARTLRVSLASTGGRLRFEVADNGCGIAKEDLTRLFSHGFTTRRGGHGFGLHSCALAASEMGGQVIAHSEGCGSGATFVLEIPLLGA